MEQELPLIFIYCHRIVLQENRKVCLQYVKDSNRREESVFSEIFSEEIDISTWLPDRKVSRD